MQSVQPKWIFAGAETRLTCIYKANLKRIGESPAVRVFLRSCGGHVMDTSGITKSGDARLNRRLKHIQVSLIYTTLLDQHSFFSVVLKTVAAMSNFEPNAIIRGFQLVVVGSMFVIRMILVQSISSLGFFFGFLKLI